MKKLINIQPQYAAYAPAYAGAISIFYRHKMTVKCAMIYLSSYRRIIVLEPADFTQTYQKYYRYVFKAADNVLHNPFDSEDVAASVFLKLYQLTLSEYEIHNINVLLYSISKNTALRYKKKYYGHDVCELNENHAADLSFEGRAVTNVIAKEMMRTLNEYNHDWCKMMYCSKVLGYSCAEIGRIFNMSPSSVRITLHRAKKYLNMNYNYMRHEIIDLYVLCLCIQFMEYIGGPQ